MKKAQILFEKPICLLVASLACFFQIGCAFLFGSMCDLGLESEPLWVLPGIGMIVGSVSAVICSMLLARNDRGFILGKLLIPTSYWFLYSLMGGCIFCFALFAPLSLTKARVFTQASFVSIALPTLLAVLDGFSFFASRELIRRVSNGRD